MMKKAIFALALVLTVFSALCAAEPIDGVWGVKFGTTSKDAYQILSGRGARLLCEYGYLPNYREAFYGVNFFGREGYLLLRFSGKGLFLARFAFTRTGELEAAEKAAAERSKGNKKYFPFTANYVHLNSMLTQKYGTASEELKESGVVCGARWTSGSFNRVSVTLYENRSLSRSDTVLTYEDTGRR